MGKMGKVTIDLEARSAGFTKGIGEAERGTLKFVKNTTTAFKDLSFDKGLNGVGIARFGGALATVSKEAEGVATRLRTGGGYGEEFSRVIDKIPIVGKFKQAGDAIYELFTGEKAATEEALKLGDAAERVSDIYREMNAHQTTRGIYGDQKAGAEIINQTNSQITDQHRQIESLQKQYDKIASKDANLHWYSDSQKAEMSALNKEMQAHRDKIHDIGKDRDQMEKDLKTDTEDRQAGYMFTQHQRLEEFDATAHEKALRREGKRTESAIYAINERARMEKEATDFETREYTLRGLSEEQRNARREAAAKKKAEIDKSAADAIRDVEQEQVRRDSEMKLASEENMKQIEVKSAIDRAKLQDDQINKFNEKRGIAERSHLAESLEIGEEYRKEVAEAEKKYREDHKTMTVDRNDPELKGQLEAAAARREAARKLMEGKAKIEAQDNTEKLAKESRAAWIGAGTEAEKYNAKLEDIVEQYKKLGDKKLLEAQMKNLRNETVKDILEKNPTHMPHIDLYGRTSSSRYIPGNYMSSGGDVVRSQLEEIKKQTAEAQKHTDLLQTIADATSNTTDGMIDF